MAVHLYKQALTIDKSTGNFVTHDESATRLWSLKKMIKSTRIEKKEDQKFLELLCMDQLERLLLIFTLKTSCEGKGGVIHVLSLNLAKIQTVRHFCFLPCRQIFCNYDFPLFLLQIDLNFHSITRFSICPSQCEVLLVGKHILKLHRNCSLALNCFLNQCVDKHRTVQSLHIEILLSKGQNATNKPANPANIYNPQKPKAAPCLKLHEVHSMDQAKAVIMVSIFCAFVFSKCNYLSPTFYINTALLETIHFNRSLAVAHVL